MKIVIVEDEPQTANVLKEIILQVKPLAIISNILESIDSVIKYLSNKQNMPDIIFMDIQLADGLCFEIFSRIEICCPVIFCTAFDQFALQAFKSNGVEYILKPIKEEAIQDAFSKIEKLKYSFYPDNSIIEALKITLVEKKSYKSSFLIRIKERFIPIPVENIALFLLENEIVYAYCFDNKKFAIYRPLDEIESELEPHLYYRINRQVLLRRNAILEIQPYFNRKVIVNVHPSINEKLIVSRLKVTSFMNWIEKS